MEFVEDDIVPQRKLRSAQCVNKNAYSHYQDYSHDYDYSHDHVYSHDHSKRSDETDADINPPVKFFWSRFVNGKVLGNPYLAVGVSASLVLVLAIVLWRRRTITRTHTGTRLEAHTVEEGQLQLQGEPSSKRSASKREKTHSNLENKMDTMPKKLIETEGCTAVLKSNDIIVYKIPRYADSLYYALAHQLGKSQITSLSHKADTTALRAQLLRHLGQNKQRYRDLLVRSAASHGDRYASLPTDEDRLERYVKDLDGFRFPPGEEILQAAADLKGVHVAVFDEDGVLEGIFHSSERDAAIVAVQRTRVAGTGKNRKDTYHYDSIDGKSLVQNVCAQNVTLKCKSSIEICCQDQEQSLPVTSKTLLVESEEHGEILLQ